MIRRHRLLHDAERVSIGIDIAFRFGQIIAIVVVDDPSWHRVAQQLIASDLQIGRRLFVLRASPLIIPEPRIVLTDVTERDVEFGQKRRITALFQLALR